MLQTRMRLLFVFKSGSPFLDEDRECWWCVMNDVVFDVLPLLQEELWNAITHGLMFFLSLFGTGFLMYKAMFFKHWVQTLQGFASHQVNLCER